VNKITDCKIVLEGFKIYHFADVSKKDYMCLELGIEKTDLVMFSDF